MGRALYTYFRSSASYRVRIALGLKGLDAIHIPVHLNRDGGEQFQSEFRVVNPQALVPVLAEDDFVLTQSLAILEYLDERYPDPPLLPSSVEKAARARQIALAIACDIHPLNNLRVLKYLTGALQISEEGKSAWARHWIGLGLEAIEAQVRQWHRPGEFCVGATPTMADCCLVPQLFNARRFGVDLASCPTLLAIDEVCHGLVAFAAAHPDGQPDTE